MGEIYTRFKELKRQSPKDWFMDKMGLVKLELNGKNYEIFFTRKRANKYSIIHYKNNRIEWEQFPVLPRIAGRMYGKREPIITLAPTKNCIRIFVKRKDSQSLPCQFGANFHFQISHIDFSTV